MRIHEALVPVSSLAEDAEGALFLARLRGQICIAQIGEKGYSCRCTRGNILITLGESEQAASQYEAAIERRANDVVIRNNLAIVEARLGRFSEAETRWKSVLTLDSSHADPRNNLGCLYGIVEDFDLVQQYLSTVGTDARGGSNLEPVNQVIRGEITPSTAVEKYDFKVSP